MIYDSKKIEHIAFELKCILNNKKSIIVGIDGCGGSGKSTLAHDLAKVIKDVTLIHMDDFYLPSNLRQLKENKPIGADFDWQRMKKQIVEPLKQGKATLYQKYNWETDRLESWHHVPNCGIIIIEGIYCLRNELKEYYDYKIFVNCPRDIRFNRGIERDGEEMREMWENNWMISEDQYMKEHRPYEKVDLILDGFKNYHLNE